MPSLTRSSQQATNSANAKKRKARDAPKARPAKRLKPTEPTSRDKRKRKTFMLLPPELRNEIYSLALIREDVVRIRPRRRITRKYMGAAYAQPWREPALLQVNRTVRSEASCMYYMTNDFEISLLLPEIGVASDWLRTIISRCEETKFHAWTLLFFAPVWKQLQEVRPLVDLIRDTGFELRHTERRTL